MATKSIKKMLQRWFLDEVNEAPIADPRCTPDCLRFEELEGYAARTLSLSPRREEHIATCAWCRRSTALYLKTRSLTVDSATTVSWSPALSGFISRLSTENASAVPSMATTGSARFDAEGTLQIRWHGVPFEGPARVQILFEGASITLARGEVQNGLFVVEAPHAELGLQDVEVPQESLLIEPDVGER